MLKTMLLLCTVSKVNVLFLVWMVKVYPNMQISAFTVPQNSVSISKSESNTFTFNSTTYKISYDGSVSWCQINDHFDFSLPIVQPTCNFACIEEDRVFQCDFFKNSNQCDSFQNETTSCTSYFNSVIEHGRCTKFMEICCRFYFRLDKEKSKKYSAIQIAPVKTIYHFTITTKTQKGKEKDIKLTISSGFKRILLEDNLILNLQSHFIDDPLPNKWYFYIKEDGNNLMINDSLINSKHEINLDKFGWFQKEGGKVVSVGRADLSNLLEVLPRGDDLSKSTYKWDLKGAFYCESDKPCPDLIGKQVNKVFEDKIQNVSMNVNKNEIKIDHRHPPPLTIGIKARSEKEFTFREKPSFTEGKVFIEIILHPFSKTDFRITIFNADWNNLISDKFIIINTTTPYHFIQSYDSKEGLPNPVWVCIITKGNNQHLCKIIDLSKSAPEGVDKISLIDFNLTQPNNQSENHFSLSKDNTLTIAITTFGVTAFFFILGGLIFYFLHYRKKIDPENIFQNGKELPENIPIISAKDIKDKCTDDELLQSLKESLKNEYLTKYSPSEIFSSDIPEEFKRFFSFKFQPVNNIHSTLTMTLEEILTNNVKNRLVIIGDPGFGKTTLSYNLAYNWAIGWNYLSKFELTILIKLRDLPFAEQLAEKLARVVDSNTSITDLVEVVEKNISKVLVILDDFDKLSDQSKKEIIPIIKSLTYPKLTVILLTRFDFFHLTDDSFRNIEKYNIKGIHLEEKQTNYLKNNMHSDCIENSLLSADVLASPLLVTTIAKTILSLASEYETVNFYKAFLALLYHQFINKNNIKIDEDNTRTLEKVIVDCENIAVNIYFSNKLSLSFEEITKDTEHILYSIGIMRRKQNNIYPEYELIHNSFVEYIASSYFRNLITREIIDDELYKNFNKALEVTVESTNDHMFFLFLFSMLKEKMKYFMKMINLYGYKFQSFYFKIFLEIIPQIELSDSMLTCFEEFYPTTLNCQWFQNSYSTAVKTNDNLNKLIGYGFNQNILNILQCNGIYPSAMPLPKYIDNVILNVKLELNYLSTVCKEKINCTNLFCSISSIDEHNSQPYLQNIFRTIKNFNPQNITFEICLYAGNILKSLQYDIANCFVENIPYSLHFIFTTDYDCKYTSDIIALLEFNKINIKGLHICFGKNIADRDNIDKNIIAILQCVSIHATVTEVVIKNETSISAEIDLKLLSSKMNKKYNCLWFHGFNLKVDGSDNSWKIEVENFVFWKFKSLSPLYLGKRIINFNTLSLEGINLSEEFSQNKLCTVAFENVSELSTSVYVNDEMTCIKQMKNLHTLHLKIETLRQQDITEFIKDFVSTISSLHIENFICSKIDKNFELTLELMKALMPKHSGPNSEINLKQIKIDFNIQSVKLNENNSLQSIFQNLKYLIKKDVVNYVCIVTQVKNANQSQRLAFFEIVDNYFANDTSLRVKHDIDGNNFMMYDGIISKYNFKNGKLCDKFIISKK